MFHPNGFEVEFRSAIRSPRPLCRPPQFLYYHRRRGTSSYTAESESRLRTRGSGGGGKRGSTSVGYASHLLQNDSVNIIVLQAENVQSSNHDDKLVTRGVGGGIILSPWGPKEFSSNFAAAGWLNPSA